MKPSELNAMDVITLNSKLVEKREELFKLRFQHATGQLEKTSFLPATRRDIARVLTILKGKV